LHVPRLITTISVLFLCLSPLPSLVHLLLPSPPLLYHPPSPVVESLPLTKFSTLPLLYSRSILFHIHVPLPLPVLTSHLSPLSHLPNAPPFSLHNNFLMFSITPFRFLPFTCLPFGICEHHPLPFQTNCIKSSRSSRQTFRPSSAFVYFRTLRAAAGFKPRHWSCMSTQRSESSLSLYPFARSARSGGPKGQLIMLVTAW
jgi:hypothetical protein